MNLQDWLFSLENSQQTVDLPAPLRCGEILSRLELHSFCPVITIGGTNGKGSTTHFISAYASLMDKKVGRFTSPHLLLYNERIAINGKNATDQQILAAFEKIKAVQGDLYLGYFDYSFLAAFIIFWQEKVDLMVLEVGLGGRLDATNAIDTDCAILTTISYDHVAILGKTREAIGLEKAGIFRSGKIAVCGDIDTPVSVRNYAKSTGAHFFEREKDFYFIKKLRNEWSCFTAMGELKELPMPHFPVQNALTGIEALALLAEQKLITFDKKKICTVLKSLTIPGRMQKLQSAPEVFVDVAHNEESVSYLVHYLKSNPSSGKVYAVFSALQDKEIAKMIKLAEGAFSDWSLVQLGHSRAAQKEILLESVSKFSHAEWFISIEDGMAAILKKLTKKDRLIIFGSFFIVSLFLKWYNENKKIIESTYV